MPLSHFFPCTRHSKPTRSLYSFCYVPHPNDIMKRERLHEMVMKKTDKKHNTEPFKVPVKNPDTEKH